MKKSPVILFLVFTAYFHALWAKDTTLPVVTVTAAIDKKSTSTSQLTRKKMRTLQMLMVMNVLR